MTLTSSITRDGSISPNDMGKLVRFVLYRNNNKLARFSKLGMYHFISNSVKAFTKVHQLFLNLWIVQYCIYNAIAIEQILIRFQLTLQICFISRSFWKSLDANWTPMPGSLPLPWPRSSGKAHPVANPLK